MGEVYRKDGRYREYVLTHSTNRFHKLKTERILLKINIGLKYINDNIYETVFKFSLGVPTLI